MNTSIALDKLDEWFKIAKPGDMAFNFNLTGELYYLYVYTEADTNPYWNLFRDVETAQAYIDAHFEKEEEPKMNKRCENCKYFACSVEAYSIIEALPSALNPAPGSKITPATIAMAIDTTVVSIIYPILTAPILPAERLLPSEAAPEIIDTATSGTTSILIS